VHEAPPHIFTPAIFYPHFNRSSVPGEGIWYVCRGESTVNSSARGTYQITPPDGPRRSGDERQRLARHLEKIVGRGGVLWRDAEILTYDTDGLVLEKFWPDLVVQPRSTEQVQEVLTFAGSNDLSIVARGAGTGLCGGCLTERGGIVLSMARMNRVLEVHPEDRLAVVQPGVVNLNLSQAVASHGLYFAPDPSSQMASTLGGNVSNNAGGPHCLKYGMTHRHILGALVVLADGEVVRVGGPHAEGPGAEVLGLVIGSEGTLAVTTEITVRLLRRPDAVRTFLGVFASVEEAAGVVGDIIGAGLIPAALEMLDRLTIEAVEQYVKVGLPLGAGAALLIELDGPEAGMDRRAVEIREICKRHQAWDFREASNERERLLLWKGRKTAFGAMGRLASGFYVMDGVVPRTRLPEMLRRAAEIVESRGLRVANVFHAGDGNLHPNVLFDVDDPDEVRRALEASKEILRACVELGGSLSGEHGIGSEKREFMPWMFSTDDLAAMKRMKTVFDPAERLNPEKIFPTGRKPWQPKPARPAPGAWM
jgi:glycolate oxidase